MEERKLALSEKKVRELAADYLARCEGENRYPSVTGLALALGMNTRQELERQAQGKSKRAGALRWALSLVEEEIIQAVYEKESSSGAKFFLQSAFGYQDKPQPIQQDDTIIVELKETEL